MDIKKVLFLLFTLFCFSEFFSLAQQKRNVKSFVLKELPTKGSYFAYIWAWSVKIYDRNKTYYSPEDIDA